MNLWMRSSLWIALLLVLAPARAGEKQKWGFIDKTGKFVIEPKFEGCSKFSEGYAAVKLGGRYGYIDKTGKLVIPAKFEYALGFSEGLAAVRVDGKWGFADTSGKIVVAPQYRRYPLPFSHGRALVEVKIKTTNPRDGKERTASTYGFIDKTGKAVIPVKLTSASSFSDGLAAAEVEGKGGFIDKDGKWVIEPRFQGCGSFSEGLAAVQVGSKWGYIDRTGKVVIPYVADRQLLDLSEGRIRYANLGGSYGFLDEKGEILTRTCAGTYKYAEGLALVYDSIYGYIDRSGKEVIPLRFPKARGFSEGLAPAAKWK